MSTLCLPLSELHDRKGLQQRNEDSMLLILGQHRTRTSLKIRMGPACQASGVTCVQTLAVHCTQALGHQIAFFGAPNLQARYWAPRMKLACLISWEGMQRGARISIFWGGYRAEQGSPNRAMFVHKTFSLFSNFTCSSALINIPYEMFRQFMSGSATYNILFYTTECALKLLSALPSACCRSVGFHTIR